MSTADFAIESARAPHIDTDRMGIPTEYGGRLYRSHLEARWAALFDALKWPFEYEPFDLAAYVPDFVLMFKRGPVLVEVKPAACIEDLRPHARKVCTSGWRGDFLVVGATLFESAGWLSLGLYGMWDREGNDGWCPADHAEALDCGVCGQASFRHGSGEFFCAVCGSTERLAKFGRADAGRLSERWAKAGNAVQWRGPAVAETHDVQF